MDAVRHLGVAEAARLEAIPPKTLLRRYERKRIILPVDPEDSRRKLIPVSALSPTAYQAWVRADTCAALQNVNGQPDAAPAESEPFLPFAAPLQTERAMSRVIPAGIPKRYQPFVDRWATIIGDCTNGTWRKQQGQPIAGIIVQSRQDFIRAQARLYGKGFSAASIHARLKMLKEVNHNPDIPLSQKMTEFWSRILPKNRPGRSGHSFFSEDENAWMRETAQFLPHGSQAFIEARLQASTR
jgi:hypothetical protein